MLANRVDSKFLFHSFSFLLSPPPPPQQVITNYREDLYIYRYLSTRFILPSPDFGPFCFVNFYFLRFTYAGVMGCGAVEATGLGFFFFVINARVLSANRVDFGLFYVS